MIRENSSNKYRDSDRQKKMLTALIVVTSVAIILLSRTHPDFPEEPSIDTSTVAPAQPPASRKSTLSIPVIENAIIKNDTNNKEQQFLETLSEIPLIVPTTKPISFSYWESKKGTPVYFKQSPEIPMLDIKIIFSAGSAQEPAEKAGLAKITNGLLIEGTKLQDSREIAAQFESVGAQFSTNSGRDFAQLSLRSLSDPEFLTTAIKLFSEVVGLPSFPEEAFERDLSVLRLNLEAIKQNPKQLVSRLIMSELYKGHPYAHPSFGTASSLEKLSLSDVISFYNAFYVAKNATIAIVGNISKSKAEAISEAVTKHLNLGTQAPEIPSAPKPQSFSHLHIEHPSQQTHISFATISVKKGAPNNPYLYFANEVFGGGGLNSILNDTIREMHGLSYTVGSYYSSMLSEGPFIISLQTKNQTARKAIQLVQKTLSEYLAHGPSSPQLELFRSNIIAGRPLQLANNQSIVSYLGNIGFYRLPHDYLEVAHQKIASATSEHLVSALRKVVQPESLLLVTLGPIKPSIEHLTDHNSNQVK